MSINDPHTVRSFDTELKRLGDELQRMGELAGAQLQAAVAALAARDPDAAAAVVAADRAIDQLESDISHDVLRLLALRQPVAQDLREVLAALRIASVIERIGDYAANIAKRTRALAAAADLPPAQGLPALAALAIELLRDAMRAYVQRDTALALQVRQRDAELDAQFTTLFESVLAHMAANPASLTAGAHLLFMAKNIERIGDHITAIAENVWFIEQGEAALEARDKRDTTSSLGS
jgi:phosphate transport system protein